MEYKGQQTRNYRSIFGEIEIKRDKYYSRDEKTYYPLDSALNLPSNKYSYLLQNWMGASAIEGAYEQSLWLINEILGQNLKGMQSQRIAEELALEVDKYYYKNPINKKEEEGEYLCIGYDGKGVPVIERERGNQTQEQNQERTRLMKGEKRGVKKEATVVTTFSFHPETRTKEEVVKSLHKEWNKGEKQEYQEKVKEQGEKPREAKNIHKRAFLCHQKLALEYGVQNVILRDMTICKPIIALVDGDRGLEKGIRDIFTDYGLKGMLDAVVLDIIHVSEYVWKVANAYLGEKSSEREQWVRSKLLQILDSEIDELIDEFEQMKTLSGLNSNAKKCIEKSVNYFKNHKHMMDYRRYLEKGYPISTGLVEGNCGHLVKDRMEMTGMRWGIDGAQNMLNIRSVKKNGDWNDFIDFVKEINKKRLYRIAA